MRPPTHLWMLLGCLIGLGIPLESVAQFGKPATEDTFLQKHILREQALLVKGDQADILLEFGAEPAFPNINTEPFFLDKNKLGKILAQERTDEDELEDQAYLENIDRLLFEYVHQFGIENFSRNVDLIWKLGRVKQLLGDTAKAIFYYELAEIHNYGTPAPVFSYDTLTEATTSEWLSIDQYYNLLEVRRKIDPLIPPKEVLKPMGPQINTKEPDYAPFMHPTDSILIFTSRRDTSGMEADLYVDPYAQHNEDLYYTEIDFRDGEWREAVRLSDTINSEFNEGSACLAPDGSTLYFTRCREGRGFGSCDIYRATYDAATGAWGHVQNLGKNVNSKSWDSQPNISSDGRTLFFVSNRRGGFGGTDLYYSTMGDDGRFGPAQNVGPMVNTPRNEVTPFFHKINSTLYFSSTGQLKNYGSYDIFKARWLGTDWESPLNVGPLINTEGNEYYFTISGKGTTIFYANAKDTEKDHVKQNFDLYSFPMPMEARPDAIASLKGFLVDSITGYPLQGTVMIIDTEEGVEVTPKKINENGYFEFDLINDRRYKLFVMGDSIFTIIQDIDLSQDTMFKVFTRSFEKNKPIVFETMEFRANSSRLGATVKPKLDYIVEFLKTYPMFKLEVEGHTDSDGRDESNMRLSLQRALSLADYITRKGEFDEDRVSAKGYGETKPIVPNDTEENKRKNRRVEFRLVFDEVYDGDMWLPTEAELKLEDKIGGDADPEFDDEFDWTEEELMKMRQEQEAWDEELLDDEDPIDLEAELEADIIRRATEGAKDSKKPSPGPKKE